MLQEESLYLNRTLPAGINHDFYTLTQVAKGMNICVQGVFRGLEKGEGENILRLKEEWVNGQRNQVTNYA